MSSREGLGGVNLRGKVDEEEDEDGSGSEEEKSGDNEAAVGAVLVMPWQHHLLPSLVSS